MDAPTGAPLRVLIADDTEDIRMLLRMTLQRDSRFEVVGEAANGREAIALADEREPDALILDLAMPVMDGLQALPEIRRRLPRCKIVVLSGFNASQLGANALALGADAYLEKGSALKRLVATLLEPRECGPTMTVPEPTGSLHTGVIAAAPKPITTELESAPLDHAQLVRAATTAATRSADLAIAFREFCAVVATAVQFDRASFWVALEDGDRYECAAVCDRGPERLAVGTTLALSSRARRILRGHSVIEPDTGLDTNDVTSRTLRASGIRSYIVVPLVIGGTTTAFIAFSSDYPHTFSMDDLPFAEQLVHETASTFHLLYLLGLERAAGSRLREADQLKNDMVDIVAHDLRSPMTVIGGYAQHMRDSWPTLTEEQKLEFLGAISRNIDNVAQIVEDMLEVASLEADRLKCTNEPFDLGELVRSTVEELGTTSQGRTFTLSLQPNLPLALGDVGRQRQILVNLIGNALKFSPPTSAVEVTVTEDEGFLRISVRDEGFGIGPDDLPKIFEKFYRATATGQTKTPGSGLGLYISRLLVEAQAGQIWGESRPGVGSTFTYTVPADKVRSVTVPSSAA